MPKWILRVRLYDQTSGTSDGASISGPSWRFRVWVSTKKTRNSPGDEIANVNFIYDDVVHVLQNTIDSCINSAT